MATLRGPVEIASVEIGSVEISPVEIDSGEVQTKLTNPRGQRKRSASVHVTAARFAAGTNMVRPQGHWRQAGRRHPARQHRRVGIPGLDLERATPSRIAFFGLRSGLRFQVERFIVRGL
jgi:hypothetical protein